VYPDYGDRRHHIPKDSNLYKNNYFMSDKDENTGIIQYMLTAWVQLPASYYSSQSVTSNEELLFKKCEKSTTYCRVKFWSR
jgi:hypothetical protein